MTARTRQPHDAQQQPGNARAVVEAARKAAAEISEMRAAGEQVCDISHILGAMRMATARARQEAMQPAEAAAPAMAR